jgi:hypothetical protein
VQHRSDPATVIVVVIVVVVVVVVHGIGVVGSQWFSGWHKHWLHLSFPALFEHVLLANLLHSSFPFCPSPQHISHEALIVIIIIVIP